ncbi:MAG: hypothetical protein GKR94_14315 [Gammaproteobacteria bacterium]|nr:hypothetical protein [Gammaproteobacteria bacterium]
MTELAWSLLLLIFLAAAGVGMREFLSRLAGTRTVASRPLVEPGIGVLEEAGADRHGEASDTVRMPSSDIGGAEAGALDTGYRGNADYPGSGEVEMLDDHADCPFPHDNPYPDTRHLGADCSAADERARRGSGARAQMGSTAVGPAQIEAPVRGSGRYWSGVLEPSHDEGAGAVAGLTPLAGEAPKDEALTDEAVPLAPPKDRLPHRSMPSEASLLTEASDKRSPGMERQPELALTAVPGEEISAENRAAVAQEAITGSDPVANELIVSLLVLQPGGENFAGDDVHRALVGAGLEFGVMHIFHHFGVTETPSARPVLSVAKVLEPGHFVEHDLATYQTPGLAVFMRLPGRQDGLVTLELLLSIAERLAQCLGGVLTDERRTPLTRVQVSRLRSQVRAFMEASS